MISSFFFKCINFYGPSCCVVFVTHSHCSCLLPCLSPRAYLHVVGMLRLMSLTQTNRTYPTPFYSVLVPVSIFLALSTVFHSIYSPNNSPFSHSVLSVLFLPHWSLQVYVSLGKSPSALIKSFVVDWA